MQIGENLKIIRRSLNISQAEFAESLNISPRMLREYEKNIYPINSDIIKILIIKYNVNPNFLFLGTNEIFLTDNYICDEEINELMNKVKNTLISTKSKKRLKIFIDTNENEEERQNIKNILKKLIEIFD